MCVVTNDRDADWHHLNSDNEDGRFENFVPLKHRLNINLRDVNTRSKKDKPIPLDRELGTSFLGSQASNHYNLGEYAQAYGCARLACVNARLYECRSVNECINLACDAPYYARLIRDYRLIEDILDCEILSFLETVPRSILGHKHMLTEVTPRTATRIIREISGLCLETGNFEKSMDLYKVISPVVAEALPDEEQYVSFLRRFAVGTGAGGSVSKAKEALHELNVLVSNNENRNVSNANTLLWLLLAEDEPREAFEMANEIFKPYEKQVDALCRGTVTSAVGVWALTELTFNFEYARLASGNTKRNNDPFERTQR